MKAFFFTGWVTQFQKGQVVDGCSSLILYGGEEEESWKRFEEYLLSPNQMEQPVGTKIEKITGSPVLEEILTETGFTALNWVDLCAEQERSLESIAPDDLSQGYWADGNELVDPHQLSPNIESLQRELPEDIGSALNWSADKVYLFLLSVLAPGETFVNVEFEAEEGYPEEEESDESPRDEFEVPQPSPFPEVTQRELSVVIRARNSVVAAWLWRKHAASALTSPGIAEKPIRIDPLCTAMPISG